MLKRVAVLAALALATSAQAQPYGPPGATDGENPNVSQINGVPVPVGEHNAYLYDYKRTNLTVNPFGVFFGYYDVGIAHGVSQNVALAASLTGVGTEMNDGYQATVSAPIYFRRTFSGPFLEPGLITRSSESSNWAGVEMLFGWQWMFDSGLNVQLAAGVARHLTSNEMSTSSSSNADANGYFRVGYAF